MPEIWKPVPGYEGKYEVSDQGRVRSLDRQCVGKDNRSELHRGKILNPAKTIRGGYLDVSLRDGEKRKHRTVHSLVAEVFIGERPKGCDVMHLNGDRTDNRANNLRYGTRKENLNQTYEYGGKQASGKLSVADVKAIRSRIQSGERLAEIAEYYGVHRAAIYHIKNGTTFKWLPEEVANG